MRALAYVLDETDNQGHGIEVRVYANGASVNWGCTSKTFTDVPAIVENVERMKAFPDAWLTLRAYGDVPVYVRLEGGRLYAATENPSDRAPHCDWEDLKAALEAVNSNEGKGLVMT